MTRPEAEVGPVLAKGRVADAIVEALRELNGDVRVTDRAAYLRVCAPGRCVLTAKAVESQLGAPFHLPGDLEKVMCSYRGRLTLSSEGAIWE